MDKMNGFWIRMVNLVVVVSVFICYGFVMEERKKAEEQLQEAAEQEYARWKEQTELLRASADLYEGSPAEPENAAGASGNLSPGSKENMVGSGEAVGAVENLSPGSKENPADPVYADGIYEGSAQGYGGEISVEVVVKEGRITEIVVLSHEKEDDLYFSMAKEEVIAAMLDRQTTEVDAASGATFSSNGIKEAVADALKGAVR